MSTDNIERERKYIVEDETIFKNLMAYLFKNKDKYKVNQYGSYNLMDFYFDTPDLKLFNNNVTFRVRSKNGETREINIKKDTLSKQDDRIEETIKLNKEFYLSNFEYIEDDKMLYKIFKDLDILNDEDIPSIVNTMAIINLRKKRKVMVKESNTSFEILSDYVRYQNRMNRQFHEERQIEIELDKGDYDSNVFEKFIEVIEKEFDLKDKYSSQSKYERALIHTDTI